MGAKFMTRSGFCEHPAQETMDGLTSHEFCDKMNLTCSCNCHEEKQEND